MTQPRDTTGRLTDTQRRMTLGTLGGTARAAAPVARHGPRGRTHPGGKGVVYHGDDPDVPRPVLGFASYEWMGSVQPANWTAVDTWVDTTGITG